MLQNQKSSIEWNRVCVLWM